MLWVISHIVLSIALEGKQINIDIMFKAVNINSSVLKDPYEEFMLNNTEKQIII